MRFYTHLRVADTAKAVAHLPAIKAAESLESVAEAVGSAGGVGSNLATGGSANEKAPGGLRPKFKQRRRLSRERVKGFEPSTFSLGS